MPIVSECGRRGGGGGSGSSSFGRRGQCSAPAASSYGSLSSARQGSDSRAVAALQCDEVESDEEVQSSYKGAFDTMDALQDALPNKRKGVFKFYNGKTNSVADASQSARGIANPVNPSPKKRKGFLPFGFSWTKPWSKGSRSRRGATNSSNNFRGTLSAALAGSAQGSSRGGGNEHQDSQEPARHCLRLHRRPHTTVVSASPPGPGALQSQAQLISVQMRSVSLGVEDVAESNTASVQKRRKSLK